MNEGKRYTYRAAAFSGVRSFSGVETGGSRVCSIIACVGDTMDTCGMRFTTYIRGATAVFEELSILATFPTPVEEINLNADDSAIFPLALKSSIMPLEPGAYSYEVITEGRLTYFNMTLKDFSEELYSFAVWGRVFATDGQEADPPIIETETNAPQTEDPELGQENNPSAAAIHVLSGIFLMPSIVVALRG